MRRELSVAVHEVEHKLDVPVGKLKESDEFLCKLVADEHSRDWLKWLIHRAEVIGERLDRGPEELD